MDTYIHKKEFKDRINTAINKLKYEVPVVNEPEHTNGDNYNSRYSNIQQTLESKDFVKSKNETKYDDSAKKHVNNSESIQLHQSSMPEIKHTVEHTTDSIIINKTKDNPVESDDRATTQHHND